MSNQAYESLGRLEVDDVVSRMKNGDESMEALGVTLKLSSTRMRTYTKGIACVTCAIRIAFFSAERQKRGSSQTYHLNAYAYNKHGEVVMMTSDHIHPKAHGGSKEDLKNRQPMCRPCNNRKADSMEGISTIALNAKRKEDSASRLLKAQNSLKALQSGPVLPERELAIARVEKSILKHTNRLAKLNSKVLE